MALVDLWTTSRNQIEDKGIDQIVAFAGDGRLRDGSEAADEFREFLAVVPTELLVRYADQCLTARFDQAGLVLQDIVNEVGRRLGFEVTHGRYRGGAGQIGYDGLWRTPDHALVVEVKTTDAYRFELETPVGYRRTLIRAGDVADDKSSILIVVGREETGGLEAQIRGSRYAWDVRLISVDALLRLLRLKEATEDPRIHQQIRSILVPREFTKLDGIIDLVFATAEDVQGGAAEELEPEPDKVPDQAQAPSRAPVGRAKRVPKKFTPVAFNDACAARIERYLGRTLVKRSRATFTSRMDALPSPAP